MLIIRCRVLILLKDMLNNQNMVNVDGKLAIEL